jgi:hypothetical protein
VPVLGRRYGGGTLRAVVGYVGACDIRAAAAGLRHELAVLAWHCHDAGRDPGSLP